MAQTLLYLVSALRRESGKGRITTLAHISMTHISRLWNEIQLNTWQELRQTLEQRRGNPDDIADDLVEQMIVVIDEYESGDRPFPESPNQLYEDLNQTLHQT